MKKQLGRPTKYDPDIHPALGWYYRQLGMSIEDIANKMGFAESTVNLWLKKHKEFSEAIKAARDNTCSGVSKRLYDRAMGMTQRKKKIELDADGEVIKTTVEETEVLPDVMAIRLYLMNVDPEHWRERKDVELHGPDGGPVEVMTPEQRKARLEELKKKYESNSK